MQCISKIEIQYFYIKWKIDHKNSKNNKSNYKYANRNDRKKCKNISCDKKYHKTQYNREMQLVLPFTSKPNQSAEHPIQQKQIKRME